MSKKHLKMLTFLLLLSAFWSTLDPVLSQPDNLFQQRYINPTLGTIVFVIFLILCALFVIGVIWFLFRYFQLDKPSFYEITDTSRNMSQDTNHVENGRKWRNVSLEETCDTSPYEGLISPEHFPTQDEELLNKKVEELPKETKQPDKIEGEDENHDNEKSIDESMTLKSLIQWAEREKSKIDSSKSASKVVQQPKKKMSKVTLLSEKLKKKKDKKKKKHSKPSSPGSDTGLNKKSSRVLLAA